MPPSPTTDLQSQCDQLRSLHRPGAPLLLPNAWDVATARAVVAAGFPVVATTSAGVAATLGYEDQEDAPADEMLAAAARIARGVEVPVTVDAEAGYGMQPAKVNAGLPPSGFRTGYVDVFAARLRTLAPKIRVVNYGCPGESTETFIHGGCSGRGARRFARLARQAHSHS